MAHCTNKSTSVNKPDRRQQAPLGCYASGDSFLTRRATTQDFGTLTTWLPFTLMQLPTHQGLSTPFNPF